VNSLKKNNSEGIIKSMSRKVMVHEDVNLRELYMDVEYFSEKYYDVPLGEVRFSVSIHDLFSVSYKHRLHLPADLTLLEKTLLTIEGNVEQLNPELSIVKMAELFGRELLKEKYNPKKVVGDLVDDFLDYKELISELPSSIKNLKSV